MPNLEKIITTHNKSIMKQNNPTTTANTCKCRNRDTCPLGGKCLIDGIIYQAAVKREDNNKNEYYVGLTENSFKTRYNAHINSFRQQNKRHSTTLSQYVWTLKDQGISYNIKWSVLAKGSPYAPSAKSCNLCL